MSLKVNAGGIKMELRRRGKTARSYRASVSYTAPYAVYVHENLAMNHPNGGQAKFLEIPARTKRREMARIVYRIMRRKKARLYDAILASAMFLKEESQKLVPVDTGYLKASAVAKVES